MKLILSIFTFFSIFSSQAAPVQIAFVKRFDDKGKLIQLEKDGLFAHIALRFDDQWIHSDSPNGVEVIDDPTVLGGEVVIIEIDRKSAVTKNDVKRFFGMAYDAQYNWKDDNKVYCSELVAKVLDIKPTPMSFEADAWDPEYRELDGNLGTSPDDIYKLIIQSHYRVIAPRCLNSLSAN